ncbi:uncharacterized protein LOC132309996 [Cornus florida]|uniref:uncharacterized protein LOC132309996 n=1 Tax=Cornus florida TaxID=4283 RepID=UPI00289C1DC2|nr:uncharacterized protein LOC132309996 [Cornus florida]
MAGINSSVSYHSLKVDPAYKPVNQKHRRFALERNQIIAEEVSKLLQAGFIREVYYPQWLSNVVVVQKKKRKWRVYIDFTNINKVCLKDSFPLPKIDQMVDAATGFERLTFLDAYSGYNQIPMNPKDEEKTAFITEKGTYCYKVMPFGLKNAGATYQRLVNKIFDEMLGKTVEAYIDDIVVKSVKKEEYPRTVPQPYCKQKVQEQRHMGTSTTSCSQSTKILHGETPNSVSLKPGETRIMYLAISSVATSVVLIREEGKNQYPIFYTSKTMTDVETRYSKAEKIILALVYAKRKLRHYFESHSIKVLTNYPMRVILSKPDLSERITKWEIELSSFDISYEPKVLHKGQALANFLLEYEDKPEELGPSEPQWELRVDGSSNLISAGAKYEALLAGLRLANQLQIEFHHIPREENSEADQLVAAASSSDEDLVRIIPIDILDEPSISPRQEIIVIPDVPREPCWMDPLEAYLKEGTLLNQKGEARKLRLTAAKYAIINNQLYRKLFSGPYLKCLSPTEALTILKQIHDGDCGNHSGGRSLAHKVLTQGYFWPYLAQNAEKYARRCDKCQRHGLMKHQPAEDLNAIANPWPFAQ